MVKSSSSLENEPCCSKACKKNIGSLNSKITELNDKLSDSENMLYYYKLGLSQVEETLKKEKEGLESKLTRFKSATKDLDNLIGSQRSDNIKEGLGYSVVPPPPAQVYSPPKKDMSWTGLSEFADDTITDYTRPSPSVESNPDYLQNNSSSASENGESTGSILSKPEIKFVRPADSLTVVKTDKKETVRKPTVKYAELYRKTSKRSNVWGNQRNWNNQKSQQLGTSSRLKISSRLLKIQVAQKKVKKAFENADSSSRVELIPSKIKYANKVELIFHKEFSVFSSLSKKENDGLLQDQVFKNKEEVVINVT
nr:hypothetical protein [Tanacetum cinerariifolium]